MRAVLTVTALSILTACGAAEPADAWADPLELEPDPIAECCECLTEAQFLGEPCAEDYGKCTLQLSDGEAPASDRCLVGGRPMCSEPCAPLLPGLGLR